MENLKNDVIANLLDFNKPNVGYEDEEKRDVCGCCGTHYVVNVGEQADLKEIVSDLYEALKELMERFNGGTRFPLQSTCDKANEALAKAEQK